ncbi:SDR family NAD(P)-dependent oxidoreductase [Parvibaculum sp.]|uniref:SDR family NAD(P)-dependent oxidoreductase n=1 Tax=Parvibaculum sp. TaxID=2024848 RepID=UPI001B08AF6E|nr:SDR family NAD(P)-dependent oxidoreductase [Parvibaculum sp.]MBO6633293.1 SDR family NAD(P)-dependent oxidoreductase [Parvibaculum sp.]MBO6678330.1 SDR family NAD(P)-dependent oxidoreductase [Parvibaculum sp.]MBO6685302.1 SDR family NAD(P)-dependent oxidoreductase [Parvibaculum sp.]MBO6904658.1 SDR family NAD(P)-dependent oxidoreductase [Parvibaculum sp.]
MTRLTQDFSGKRVFVTGGTQGIGAALVAAFTDAGAEVLTCGRTVTPSPFAVAADIATDEGRAAIISAVARLSGPLDILIHNAGTQQALDYANGTIGEAADQEIAVNLVAPIRLTETLLPYMVRGGAICFLTSVLAYKPKTSAPVYCASKAGLRSFALALRQQLAPQELRVVEIVPPLVATAMTGGRGRGKISPERVARAVLTGLTAGTDRIAIGKAGPALFLDRWAPRLLSRMMARQ